VGATEVTGFRARELPNAPAPLAILDQPHDQMQFLTEVGMSNIIALREVEELRSLDKGILRVSNNEWGVSFVNSVMEM
jgi:hypothetical protein